jgi:hypothetical protein
LPPADIEYSNTFLHRFYKLIRFYFEAISMPRQPRLFISYSKQDVEFVRYLAALLKAQHFDIWYDSELNPGDDWWIVLEREIHACDAFVVVMTPAGRSSRWVLRELLLAEKIGKPVFPVLLAGDVWPNLADVQFVDMRAGLRATLPARLLEQLQALTTHAPASRWIQLAFEHADIMTYPADVAAFKYAQSFHGADGHAAALLRNEGIDESDYTPYPGEYSLIASQNALTAEKVLFVGTERLKLIGYEGYQRLAVEILKALHTDAPDTKHLVMTFHGGGHGLDENEAALSQLRGLISAVADDQYPPALERITIVERADGRFRRLQNNLDGLLSQLGIAREGDTWPIPARSDAAADTVQVTQPPATPPQRTHAFVIMPPDPALDDLFYYAIQTPVHAYGLLCERLEAEEYDADVIRYLEERLSTAAVVVALLPTEDPMLFWQVGYARGAGSPVILLSNEAAVSPMLQGLSRLTYNRLRDVESGLGGYLQQLQQGGKL